MLLLRQYCSWVITGGLVNLSRGVTFFSPGKAPLIIYYFVYSSLMLVSVCGTNFEWMGFITLWCQFHFRALFSSAQGSNNHTTLKHCDHRAPCECTVKPVLLVLSKYMGVSCTCSSVPRQPQQNSESLNSLCLTRLPGAAQLLWLLL